MAPNHFIWVAQCPVAIWSPSKHNWLYRVHPKCNEKANCQWMILELAYFSVSCRPKLWLHYHNLILILLIPIWQRTDRGQGISNMFGQSRPCLWSLELSRSWCCVKSVDTSCWTLDRQAQWVLSSYLEQASADRHSRQLYLLHYEKFDPYRVEAVKLRI